MKEVTKRLINNFKIMKLGIDFCGYKIDKCESLDFHHLIIPKRHCCILGIPEGGYMYWNGVVLNHNSSHPYLHLVEVYDRDKFVKITSEMMDIKHKGFLDEDNLIHIGEIFSEFEYKFGDYYTKKGKKLIKSEYLNRKYK